MKAKSMGGKAGCVLAALLLAASPPAARSARGETPAGTVKDGGPAPGLAPEARARFLAAIVPFERSYIPALLLTAEGQQEPSQRALRRLDGAWERLRSAAYDAHPANPDWKADFDRVAARLLEADELAGSGDLGSAHRALEQVRGIWLELRRRHGIVSLHDYLTEFDRTAAALRTVAAGTTGEEVTATDRQRMQALIAQARAYWVRARRVPLDAAQLGLEPGDLDYFPNWFAAEMGCIEGIEEALEYGQNSEWTRRAAGKLGTYFERIYRTLGDFGPPPASR